MSPHLWLSAESLGRIAVLTGLKGRLTADGIVTEDAVFWNDEGIGYHEIDFQTTQPERAGGGIRKGRLDLSGVSFRIGLGFRM